MLGLLMIESMALACSQPRRQQWAHILGGVSGPCAACLALLGGGCHYPPHSQPCSGHSWTTPQTSPKQLRLDVCPSMGCCEQHSHEHFFTACYSRTTLLCCGVFQKDGQPVKTADEGPLLLHHGTCHLYADHSGHPPHVSWGQCHIHAKF